MRGHRAAFWTAAVAHLGAAVATGLAGVPVASTLVLALVALVAFGLGLAGPADAVEAGRRRRGHRMGRLVGTGTAVDEDGLATPAVQDRAVR